MFNGNIYQDVALEEKNTGIAGSALIADLLYLHLRLHIIGKCPESAGSITKAGCFDLHGAAATGIGSAFHVGKAILFQHRSVRGIGSGRVWRCLYALWLKMPAAEGRWQRTNRLVFRFLAKSNRRQEQQDGNALDRSEDHRTEKGSKHHSS